MTDTPEDQRPPPLVRTNISHPPTDPGEDDYIKWEAEDQAKKLHALFANRVFVQPDGDHLRLTFGERVGEDTVYHTSIVVPNADALAFGELMHRMARAGLEHQLAYYRDALEAIEQHEKTMNDQADKERTGASR